MKFKPFKIDKELIFDFPENKDIPESEQAIAIFGSIPNAGDRCSYQSYRYGTDGKSIELAYQDNMLVRRHVKRIENFNDGTKDIRTAEDLIKSKHPKCKEAIIQIRLHLFDLEPT